MYGVVGVESGVGSAVFVFAVVSISSSSAVVAVLVVVAVPVVAVVFVFVVVSVVSVTVSTVFAVSGVGFARPPRLVTATAGTATKRSQKFPARVSATSKEGIEL
ncbi:hypothetical protein [Halorussus caseinilyticus]|uniref:Uncharacterized protein n=1 Tax=Halorussus caseinilyticus TaxID=3034025 RepID=A0ABD5WRK1_9EURY|nr:hypothetical protein [Halorussus sp. DT72]